MRGATSDAHDERVALRAVVEIPVFLEDTESLRISL